MGFPQGSLPGIWKSQEVKRPGSIFHSEEGEATTTQNRQSQILPIGLEVAIIETFRQPIHLLPLNPGALVSSSWLALLPPTQSWNHFEFSLFLPLVNPSPLHRDHTFVDTYTCMHACTP